ncbi:YchJ family protein [Corynebacterium uberis]|uniref:YchJ family protein n=1 Tax=Corynebacterium TaxID=1716 RepID=UPI001D0B4AC6|nr:MULTISPECIES: YchJ family metal-binding protein [Corynebacterium]MCZ9308704.1 hypothetical protein [Corynebacterium sp. c6VSa_13]UDL74342.1 hypothetical protein LH391_03825 [Corynebacterium uberis]UDL76825.1 hypothetical protein LH393_05575 [Corynebacterium uberis]UDL79038.1 hypothetical protein LH394_05565 [Corynebacterium uberis]UDL79276.1 hypothetical protein LH392_05980 [Corynebacterium uberis]
MNQVNIYPDSRRCPCGTGLSYGECCRRYHAGHTAPTAAALMRSRFSAFAVGDADYLLATWDPATRPADLDLKDSPVRFYRLEIYATTGGGLLDERGTVDFEAFFKPLPGSGAAAGSQRENSEFVRRDGRWFYVQESSL